VMGAVSTLPESVVVLAGAQMRAECGIGSRTQQISRKHPYKTLDLQRHKSVTAMTTPKRAFCTITRKEIARSVKALGALRVCWHANARRFSKSFGGRLAQIQATEASDLGRRAWSSAEEFAFELARPCRLGAINALPLLARIFARGEGGGRGVSSPQASELLHLTVFKINCNGWIR
jgi:hypothetical protein